VATVEILIQIIAIMYWIIMGLLIIFTTYTPPKNVIAATFILTGILIAILVFVKVPTTEVHIHYIEGKMK